MNSALTRPQSLQELYKTYFSFANRFKFTDLLRNYIQNEEWKDKSQKPVWDLLSKISDDIGAVLTDDIVNYTRNVVDINTCKVPQLIEQAWMLSYRLDHLKNSYAFLPKRIQVLVDVFSINPEYLIGNYQNHILSDEVIKEILVYIRENVKDKTPFTNDNAMDKLIDDPHSLLNTEVYRNFVTQLFYVSIVQALSSPYSDEDSTPIAFNLLWRERQNQQNILSRLDEYRSWVDKYIWNEIEYPLNDSGMSNTIYDLVEQVKNQKQMSSKFNPFKVADSIYFNGLNPTHGLSKDELDLVETVIDYHSRTKYDYETEQFVDDDSTKFAYYRELEWCEYVKMVMFVMNNINSFDMTNLSYDTTTNKFIRIGSDETECLRVVKIFNNDDFVVEDAEGEVALNSELILKVAKFLCNYVFHVSDIRENLKTVAQKHAMRGTGALLVHIVNDFLIKELPIVRDMMYDGVTDEPVKFMWETNEHFRNYGNVKVLEYEDDNEYFNIDPDRDVRFTQRTNDRYWEQLEGMGYEDSLGVLTKGQIKDFYRDVLGMGRLQPKKARNYDDVCDFLVDLFKIGANPVEWKSDQGEFYNPIDDIYLDSQQKYGYTKAERLEVQNNTQLRKNQEEQFLSYSGNEDLIGDGIYDLVNNRIFYWKNTDYSSHVLHPFMYNLKLWNKLNNIIINGYKDYLNTDLIDYLSSKVKFDELFGKLGESKNFWKYNVMDLTGYTTRYEAAIKDEHLDDFNNTVSPLTGYDGLFYPDAAREFLELLNENGANFDIPQEFFTHNLSASYFSESGHKFVTAMYSIYWQTEDSFYTKWYSHLNYTRSEYQKIAIQLWYWRDRIAELITTEYPITKYCLDIQGNSLILVSTFADGAETTNPYLIDLALAHEEVQNSVNGNRNTHVPFCENKLVKPSELWIRWKSNPIAMPAFDVLYDSMTGDEWFDFYYRENQSIELGQLTHTNNDCNENFKIVLTKWRKAYGNLISGNMLPVFFDMEQSANVLALASWYSIKSVDDDGIVQVDEYGNEKNVTCCSKNPLHILSIERTSSEPSEYNLEQYTSSQEFSSPGLLLKWLFDSYQYCQANGALAIPMYRFDCVDDGSGNDRQFLDMKVFYIPAQEVKGSTYATNERVSVVELPQPIDLCGKVDFVNGVKYRFDRPVKACRNTNVVFSVHEMNGTNRLKLAFLGSFDTPLLDGSYKKNSCDAKTRYGFDSQSTVDLSLVKGRYHEGNDVFWTGKESNWRNRANNPNAFERRYIDSKIAPNRENPGESKFNSYDSMDKFVMVVDFEPSIDSKDMFKMSAFSGMRTYSYNILSDAGYIPHFAYQSLLRYDKDDKECGTSFTWRNEYLNGKNHMQFELLGLDDKELPKAYEQVNRMVVEDVTDECKTLVCPAKFMDDIYRVWCETVGYRRRQPEGEEPDLYESYFANEYVDYTNPVLDFSSVPEKDGMKVIEWDVCEDKDNPMFELDLPVQEQRIDLDDSLSDEEKEQKKLDIFKSLLDEYYVYVMRTEKGNILNEKRYILKPTQISQFILGMGGEDGYIRCNLSKYQSANIKDNHFVTTQVVFTGTPNPFNYDNDGERIYSQAEELQYGNSVKGVDAIELKIDVVGEVDEKALIVDEHGNVVLDENSKPKYRTTTRKWLRPTVRFIKSTGSGTTLSERVQAAEDVVPAGEVTVMFSHKNLDNIAKYHILNASSDLYFGGSLPKEAAHENQFKYSDFKFGQTVKLKDDGEGGWVSIDTLEDGITPVLQFTSEQVKSAGRDNTPPYYLGPDNDPVWFLEQDELVESGRYEGFKYGEKLYYDEFYNVIQRDYVVCGPSKSPMVSYIKFLEEDGSEAWQTICDPSIDLQTICWGPKGMPTITGKNLGEILCGNPEAVICASTPIVEQKNLIVCRPPSAFSGDPDWVDDGSATVVSGIAPNPVMCKDPQDDESTLVCGTDNEPLMCKSPWEDSFETICGHSDFIYAKEEGPIIWSSYNRNSKSRIPTINGFELGFLYTNPDGPIVCQPYNYLDGKQVGDDFGDQVVCAYEVQYGDALVCMTYAPFHVARVWNDEMYPVPAPGKFRWAHKVKAKPEKYLDYFYIKTGNLQFKVSEESTSFADAMSMIPPFYIDVALRNKLQDLNDVQLLKEYSTFVHQSEEPDKVKDCSSFNPLLVDSVLRYGVAKFNNGDNIKPDVMFFEKYMTVPQEEWPIVSQQTEILVTGLTNEDYESLLEVICQKENQLDSSLPLIKSDGSGVICAMTAGVDWNAQKYIVCGMDNRPLVCNDSDNTLVCYPEDGVITINDQQYLVCGGDHSPLLCGSSDNTVVTYPEGSIVNWNAMMNDEKFLVCGPENQPLMCGDSYGFIYSRATGPIVCHGTSKGTHGNTGLVFAKPTLDMIALNNFTEKTRLKLQLEDSEIDDYLKIYTNYVRVDDGHGDFHYDLYFNIQNLFNSPFEYLSTVSGQPNVLILPDSYLYLPGNKYKKVLDKDGKWVRNEVDPELVKKLKDGGTLTIYGQVKTYSDDKLSDVKTIKLFSYNVYNVSDDKPKFLIDKVFDITKTPLQENARNTIQIEFSDVLWTIDEERFPYDRGVQDGSVDIVAGKDDGYIMCFNDRDFIPVMSEQDNFVTDKYRELDKDVILVQPLKIRYNWGKDDDYRLDRISFDIVNDVIDFENIPQMLGYSAHERTLRNYTKVGKPYYDRWSDRYMTLETNPETCVPRLTLRYDENAGHNFETVFLRWKLPKGMKIMDIIDRLGGYVFSSTANNIEIKSNNESTIPIVDVKLGHVVARVHQPGKMYLGVEHSTTNRINGYVLTGLADDIRRALEVGEKNPTLERYAASERSMKITAEQIMT